MWGGLVALWLRMCCSTEVGWLVIWLFNSKTVFLSAVLGLPSVCGTVWTASILIRHPTAYCSGEQLYGQKFQKWEAYDVVCSQLLVLEWYTAGELQPESEASRGVSVIIYYVCHCYVLFKVSKCSCHCVLYLLYVILPSAIAIVLLLLWSSCTCWLSLLDNWQSTRRIIQLSNLSKPLIQLHLVLVEVLVCCSPPSSSFSVLRLPLRLPDPRSIYTYMCSSVHHLMMMLFDLCLCLWFVHHYSYSHILTSPLADAIGDNQTSIFYNPLLIPSPTETVCVCDSRTAFELWTLNLWTRIEIID